MEKGEKKRRLDFCMCFKEERNKYMYLVLTILSSMTYLLCTGMFKSSTLTKDGANLRNPYSGQIKNHILCMGVCVGGGRGRGCSISIFLGMKRFIFNSRGKGKLFLGFYYLNNQFMRENQSCKKKISGV